MSNKIVCRNKKAFHDYFIEETIEVGIVLQGTEVKSLRVGKVNLMDSYAYVKDGEMVLMNAHISPYSHGNRFNADPTRSRKLLLHRKEIKRFTGKVRERGYSLIPLSIYFKNGKAKVEIALAKGKKLFDKRETLKKKTAEREMERAFRGKK
jgi:SsrA-binding protein